MPINAKVSSSYVSPQIWARVAGVARLVQSGYVKVGGVIQLFHSAFSSTLYDYDTAGSGALVIPVGCNYMTVFVAGPGGNGYLKSSGDFGGGGGGGGWSNATFIPITSSDWERTISYTVGSTGVASTVSVTLAAGTRTLTANSGATATSSAGAAGGTASGGDYNGTGSAGTTGGANGGNGGNGNNAGASTNGYGGVGEVYPTPATNGSQGNSLYNSAGGGGGGGGKHNAGTGGLGRVSIYLTT